MRPVRHHLGISAFGTNAWTAANQGDRLLPEHREDEGKEELYVVLRGRARFEIDGDSADAPLGTLVFVGPESNRTAFAEEAGTTVLAIGSTVGQPYEVGGWEVWAEFHPHVRGRRLRRCDRPRTRAGRGERVRRTAVQPRLLRGAGWPQRGRDRSSPDRVRAAAGAPRPRQGGHRPEPASGRAGVSRARQLSSHLTRGPAPGRAAVAPG